MLKDIFNEIVNKNKKAAIDKIVDSIADGYVDIKVYDESSGSKKLVYHDTGDNTVTDWMRQAIIVMLTGGCFSPNGKKNTSTTTESATKTEQYSTPCVDTTSNKIHAKSSSSDGINYDGYIINGGQYFWDPKDFKGHYSSTTFTNDIYPIFPTKVLLGTGKEYNSWSELETECQGTYSTYYANMLTEYGGDSSTATTNFDNNIATSDNSNNCNIVSGTISKGVYTSYSTTIQRARTVNDPDSSITTEVSSSASKNYGVIGPIKTMYFSEADDESKLMSTISDSGNLLLPTYRGVGRPCFIYMNKKNTSDDSYSTWDTSTSEVAVSANSGMYYLNKITFKVTMPAQTDTYAGTYYPYNGYTLKQIGLYNDALRTLHSSATTGETEGSISSVYKNMPCGTLLAIKNMTPFSKTAGESVVLTWTLTI